MRLSILRIITAQTAVQRWRVIKMTIEEIKSQLEELIKDRESFMVGDYDKEALEFAVKAVEKQIQKKLKAEMFQTFIQGYLYEDKCCVCPSCGTFRGNLDYKSYKIKKYSYCPDCGQALDWSDENE